MSTTVEYMEYVRERLPDCGEVSCRKMFGEYMVYINGKPETTYTFKYDYYWMMGDNRHNSADSRSWGFVPEDHIVGKPIMIWLSLDKDRSLFDGGIRWNRMFRWVHPD